MKVAINTCFGGFNLSQETLAKYNELSGKNIEYQFDIKREDPFLIQAIEEIGVERAGGDYSELKIVEIPDNIAWYIYEYDGVEEIHEHHRIWN
jgi:hypothetical protein